MLIAIFGCGPAGLLAAHASVRAGHQVRIYSRRIKSQIYAAMFLHRPIPGIHVSDEPEMLIDVTKVGCRAGYATNVYGDPTAPVSWDLFKEGWVPAWSLSMAYNKLWVLYNHLISDAEVGSYNIEFLSRGFDIVYSTIPARHLCVNPDHTFKSQDIWVMHGSGETHLIRGVNDGDLMYYNGWTPDGKYGMIGPDWYRFSQINLYQSWEYRDRPSDAWLEDRTLSHGTKPLWTDCNCHSEIHRIGRFGKWEKNILTHHTYEEVERALQQVQ